MVVQSKPVPIRSGTRTRAPRFSRLREEARGWATENTQPPQPWGPPPPDAFQASPPFQQMPPPPQQQIMAFENPYNLVVDMGNQFVPASSMGYVNAPLPSSPVFMDYPAPPFGYPVSPPYPMPLSSSPPQLPPAGFGFEGYGYNYGSPPPPYSMQNMAYYGSQPEFMTYPPWIPQQQSSPPPPYHDQWQQMPPPPPGINVISVMASQPNQQDYTTDGNGMMIIPVDPYFAWGQDGIVNQTQDGNINAYGGTESPANQMELSGGEVVSSGDGATGNNSGRKSFKTVYYNRSLVPQSGSARRGNPGPAKFCSFCKNNRETREWYESHVAKTDDGKTCCPILQKYVCPICGATGDKGHTLRYCPENPDSLLNRPRSMSLMSERSFRQRKKRNSRGVIGQYRY